MDSICTKKKLSARMLLIYLLLFDVTVIIAAIAIGIHDGKLLRYFGEGYFITWISAMLLFITSWLAYTILNARCSKSGHLHWRSPFVIWALISFGFLFLAFDELFMIHESFDQKIHHFFNMKTTNLSDRIDDLIIGLYAAFGIGTLYAYRKEMRNYSQALPFITIGFALLFIMVAFDALTNRKDILIFFIEQPDSVNSAYVGFSIAEEFLKIMAESFFLVGFYSASPITK